MDFETLEEARHLSISYEGPILDLYALGVLHLSMQNIVDKTSFWVLSGEDIIDSSRRRPRFPPFTPARDYPRLVRADIVGVTYGSWLEDIAFSLAGVLSNPIVQAVLEDLAANVIWAVGASGVVSAKKMWTQSHTHSQVRRDNDPVGVRPDINSALIALAENSPGESWYLEIDDGQYHFRAGMGEQFRERSNARRRF